MSRSTNKAAHYIQLLDEVRCEGDWDAVPECIRKVRKHAPNRVCLTLTAETELAIERATRNQPTANRPSSSSAIASPTSAGPATAPDLAELAGQLPKLQEAIAAETQYPQDRFQARVCVGWLHWVAGEYDQSLASQPGNLDDEFAGLNDAQPERLVVSDWTRVCALKSAYLRANCLGRQGKPADALAVFEEGLPCLTTAHPALAPNRKQLRYWSELFLTEYCMLTRRGLEKGAIRLEDPNCLISFRSWAKYWEGTTTPALLGGYGFRGGFPRRRIWFEYYSILSALLEDDLPYPTAYAPATAGSDSSARSQLRMELKRIEAVYETLLLEETSFPRAEEERQEVEGFVQLAVENWTLMKGRGWREQDLGEGGKESLSRGMLDILYRASTKTYHSTAILRHLFSVHLAVAEFDLAFKAFDTYLDLIKKGKARVVKAGIEEPSLDADETVLETLALCIAALCRYGVRDAAEKAHDLGHELEQCLEELTPATVPERVVEEEDDVTPSPLPTTNLVAKTRGANIPPRILALCWQSVGLAAAQWSRMTFDSTARPEIQAKAVRCLRKSLSPEFGRSTSLRGVFALGLLLAEQRELSAAIELVRGALLTSRASDTEPTILHGSYWRERALVPLWHLLALLLSARQDYLMAARACEGAFEQFKDPAILFGSETTYRSEHLNEAEAAAHPHDAKRSEASRGVVDDMDDYEKERILEVKMTQLALVELLESPKIAVNASLELLSLYARLFGPLATVPASPALAAAVATTKAAADDVPRSSAGTLRSLKGSIFGRGSDRSGRPTTRQSTVGGGGGGGIDRQNSVLSRPQTTQTIASSGGRDAPTIQITATEGGGVRSRRSGSHSERRSLSGKRRNSLRKPERSVSRQRAVSGGSSLGSPSEPPPHPLVGGDGGDGFLAASPLSSTTAAEDGQLSNGRRRLAAAPPVSLSRQASQVDSILALRSRNTATAAAVAGGSGNLNAGDATTDADGVDASLSLMPMILFPAERVKVRRSTVLVEVWLMIAGFYRRAGMFEDAKGAVDEAQRLVQALDGDRAKDTSVWAEKKSLDELAADVWAELGNLDLEKGDAYAARADFEAALVHFPDHAEAIVGLSNILLDVYKEELVPPPAIPLLELADGTLFPAARQTKSACNDEGYDEGTARPPVLGLTQTPEKESAATSPPTSGGLPPPHGKKEGAAGTTPSGLRPPHKATTLPLQDRLAARDRAYSLLAGLTKLGSAWNRADAWFALARAHEESGQADKAKEVLWWCVELEEATGVRPWGSVVTGGYVL